MHRSTNNRIVTILDERDVSKVAGGLGGFGCRADLSVSHGIRQLFCDVAVLSGSG